MSKDVLTLEQLQEQLSRREAYLWQLEAQAADAAQIQKLKKDILLTRKRIERMERK